MVPVSSSRPAIHGATILLGVFTMTLAHGTDRLESARLVLRRIAPGELPLLHRKNPPPKTPQYPFSQSRPRGKKKKTVRAVRPHKNGRTHLRTPSTHFIQFA